MSRDVERLFLAVPWGCLQFVIVVFSDHTHLLFFIYVYFYCKFIDITGGVVGKFTNNIYVYPYFIQNSK